MRKHVKFSHGNNIVFICVSDGLGFGQVYLSCPTEVALERNKGRVDQVPDDIIVNMQSRFEAPDSHEMWEQHSIEINTSDNFDG